MNIDQYLISKDTKIREVLQILDRTAKRVLFVAESRKLLGSITDGDIRRWILASGSLEEPVSKAMHVNPRVIDKQQINRAQSLMGQYEVFSLPVMNEENEIIDLIFWNDSQNRKKKGLALKVVIMAGGKGERLLPYTRIVPKPLMPIGEKPIVELIIDSFKQYGCKKYYLTINYKKNMIKAYFDDIDKDYEIFYVEEDRPLGTAGSLYYLIKDMKNTFFVSNCDILLDTDYADIYDFHKKYGNIITVVTSLKRHILPYGVINLNESGYVGSITEKPTMDYLINTGVYLIEPEALTYLEENQFMHITDLIEKCIKEGKQIGAFPISDDAWMDMGQFEDMEKMKERLSR